MAQVVPHAIDNNVHAPWEVVLCVNPLCYLKDDWLIVSFHGPRFLDSNRSCFAVDTDSRCLMKQLPELHRNETEHILRLW